MFRASRYRLYPNKTQEWKPPMIRQLCNGTIVVYIVDKPHF